MDLLDLPTVEIGPWALREGVILRRLDSLRDGPKPMSPEPMSKHSR